MFLCRECKACLNFWFYESRVKTRRLLSNLNFPTSSDELLQDILPSISKSAWRLWKHRKLIWRFIATILRTCVASSPLMETWALPMAELLHIWLSWARTPPHLTGFPVQLMDKCFWKCFNKAACWLIVHWENTSSFGQTEWMQSWCIEVFLCLLASQEEAMFILSEMSQVVHEGSLSTCIVSYIFSCIYWLVLEMGSVSTLDLHAFQWAVEKNMLTASCAS